MVKLRQQNLREPVRQVTATQAVTPAHRIINPADAARAAAARRNETRWRWYVRLVVRAQ